MKTKIFIDGSEGTTGLRIYERFEGREDIELLKIDPEKRKDVDARREMINASDVTFLCLPDAAAREAITLIDNNKVKIIDTSTAHRTEEGWAYGFPELSDEHKKKIETGSRIAVPGCHASGFVALSYPLVSKGIMPADYPVTSFSITGFSGGGKKTIAQYEDENRPLELSAPREYALSQQHKHLKEMKQITGLTRTPLFSPIIADYYSGMVVSIPLYTDFLTGDYTPEKLRDFYATYYQGEKFIEVMPMGNDIEKSGYLSGNGCSGWDGMKLYVTGNEERIVVSAQFDNLGKGASGAAIECLNLMLGCESSKGLNL